LPKQTVVGLTWQSVLLLLLPPRGACCLQVPAGVRLIGAVSKAGVSDMAAGKPLVVSGGAGCLLLELMCTATLASGANSCWCKAMLELYM
jgi:hypothetical protein